MKDKREDSNSTLKGKTHARSLSKPKDHIENHEQLIIRNEASEAKSYKACSKKYSTKSHKPSIAKTREPAR